MLGNLHGSRQDRPEYICIQIAACSRERSYRNPATNEGGDADGAVDTARARFGHVASCTVEKTVVFSGWRTAGRESSYRVLAGRTGVSVVQ